MQLIINFDNKVLILKDYQQTKLRQDLTLQYANKVRKLLLQSFSGMLIQQIVRLALKQTDNVHRMWMKMSFSYQYISLLF